MNTQAELDARIVRCSFFDLVKKVRKKSHISKACNQPYKGRKEHCTVLFILLEMKSHGNNIT